MKEVKCYEHKVLYGAINQSNSLLLCTLARTKQESKQKLVDELTTTFMDIYLKPSKAEVAEFKIVKVKFGY